MLATPMVQPWAVLCNLGSYYILINGSTSDTKENPSSRDTVYCSWVGSMQPPLVFASHKDTVLCQTGPCCYSYKIVYTVNKVVYMKHHCTTSSAKWNRIYNFRAWPPPLTIIKNKSQVENISQVVDHSHHYDVISLDGCVWWSSTTDFSMLPSWVLCGL